MTFWDGARMPWPPAAPAPPTPPPHPPHPARQASDPAGLGRARALPNPSRAQRRRAAPAPAQVPFLGTRKKDEKGKLGAYTWMTYLQARGCR
jgi:hypothetical protein